MLHNFITKMFLIGINIIRRQYFISISTCFSICLWIKLYGNGPRLYSNGYDNSKLFFKSGEFLDSFYWILFKYKSSRSIKSRIAWIYPINLPYSCADWIGCSLLSSSDVSTWILLGNICLNLLVSLLKSLVRKKLCYLAFSL